ncbi:MAG: hypothetical protein ACYS8Z_01305 [Planctomycetota bacterium]|jgi:hypothetical protein
MKGMRDFGVGVLILFVAVVVGCRSAPEKRFSEWKTFELREDLSGDYDKAWEEIFKTVDRMWGLKNARPDTGYIETGWVYTETNMYDPDHRKRFVILLPPSATTFKIRSGSQSMHCDRDLDGTRKYCTWRPAQHSALRSRTYYDLVNKIGRTVLNE